MLGDVVNQEVKVLAEDRLWLGVELDCSQFAVVSLQLSLRVIARNEAIQK
jgi:hypothetical protein